MENEIKKLREEINFYKEYDNKYIVTKSKSGDTIRKLIKYDDHMMRILDLEVENYAKIFEKEDDEKNIITYILLEIYALINYPVLLDFNKFLRYLEANRTRIEDDDEIMAKLSVCYKLLDSNRIIDKSDILSFLSEGYKNFAENDNKSDIFINVLPKKDIIRIVENDEVVDELDTVLRYLIFTGNEENTGTIRNKLNLKLASDEEEKSLLL